MEPAINVRIDARSHRQAMDWSLVLVSQGIECTIEEDGTGRWGLVVSAQEHARARQSIDLYRAENRHWHWRQELFKPGLLFDWASLLWLVLLVTFFVLSNERPMVESAGVMDKAGLARGQWWRLFTAMWLHADVAHLASNGSIGLVLLGLTMGRYGTGAGLLAAYLAGVGGNLMDWMLAPGPRVSLGASGLLMGCLGLLAAQSLTLWHRSPRNRKLIVSGIFGGIMLFVLLGLNPGSDLLAHAGGFLTGLLLGSIFTPVTRVRQTGRRDLLAGITFGLLVMVPWAIGLGRAAR